MIGVNKNITSKIVEENLNTVDFDTYTELINDIKSKDIPKIMVSVNQILDNGVAGDLFLSGLSSFYRDILVSKNKLSHNLLNYEDKRIKTLLSLSSDINFHILIEYINLLNEAEINFQKSLNQRLLIELSILKISSLEFNEEKKKFKYRLIPISNFQSQVFISQQSNAIEQKKPKPIANLSVSKFQTSTLSLKSIEKNKEINDLDLDSEVEYSNNNELILEDIIEVWDNYTNIQEEKGRYNIASILRISSPKFKNNTIIYSVPNNTTSLEIDSEKQNLLLFLRNKLESDIGLLIEIDKKMDENKAYTNKDKFEVLKKKNPLIDELRNTFKLSI